MRRLLTTLLLLLAVVAAPARADLSLMSEQPLGDRLTDLTFRTDALRDPVGVRVLLPAGYATNPARRYPVLYLLHGAGETHRSWVAKGAAEAAVGDAEVIVVMPDGGRDGWYTDWVNEGRRGPPQWRRFHLEQLVPWIEARYRTVDDRRARGIAGMSMGGLGALNYARARPDHFSWAASFSGALDVTAPTFAGQIVLWSLQRVGRPFPQFGDPVRYGHVWRAHNPLLHARELRDVRVVLTTGNGLPGPLDRRGSVIDPGEVEIHRASHVLHRRLNGLGIEHGFTAYGNGRHTVAYASRELRRWLPDFLARQPG